MAKVKEVWKSGSVLEKSEERERIRDMGEKMWGEGRKGSWWGVENGGAQEVDNNLKGGGNVGVGGRGGLHFVKRVDFM